MIRYDLNDLEPAVRRGIVNQVQSRGVPHSFVGGVLSVPDEFEALTDSIVESNERSGRTVQEVQNISRSIDQGTHAYECDRCGAQPAGFLRLRRQVGMVVVMKTETVEGHFCLGCGRSMRAWIQKQNAMKGWTGVKSALMNPVVISTNEKAFREFENQIERNRT